MIRWISMVGLIFILTNPVRVSAEQPAGSTDTASALHLIAGVSGALAVSAVAYPLVDLGSDRDSALLVAGLGVGGALVLGLTKELLDLSGWGQAELSDLLLTIGGGVIAGTLVYALSSLYPHDEEGRLGISGIYGAFALILSIPVGQSLYRRFILSSRSRS